ncbi:MAG: hypothetical protein HKM06_04760, partial [Spirochaetales bacterium]|nr:hypothetical protein [Spirochaetales bacterium]
MRKSSPIRNIFLIGLLVTAAVLESCSVQADLFVHENGSGLVSTHLKWQEPLNLYWNDLRELDTTLGPKILDQKILQGSLEQKASGPGAFLASPHAEVGSHHALISFDVSDPDQAVKKGGVTLFSLKKTSNGTELRLSLDRPTLMRWLDLTTYGHSPAIAALFPENETEADLRANLIYALGSYTQDALALVNASNVEITLHLPSPVQKVEGGKIVGPEQVVCRWPLVKVLAL